MDDTGLVGRREGVTFIANVEGRELVRSVLYHLKHYCFDGPEVDEFVWEVQ